MGRLLLGSGLPFRADGNLLQRGHGDDGATLRIYFKPQRCTLLSVQRSLGCHVYCPTHPPEKGRGRHSCLDLCRQSLVPQSTKWTNGSGALEGSATLVLPRPRLPPAPHPARQHPGPPRPRARRWEGAARKRTQAGAVFANFTNTGIFCKQWQGWLRGPHTGQGPALVFAASVTSGQSLGQGTGAPGRRTLPPAPWDGVISGRPVPCCSPPPNLIFSRGFDMFWDSTGSKLPASRRISPKMHSCYHEELSFEGNARRGRPCPFAKHPENVRLRGAPCLHREAHGKH